MQYAQLGRSGVFVSRFCLGAMTFGGGDNAVSNALGRLSPAEADAIVSPALEAGINFIDTADVYGRGASETVLGEILGPRRSGIVLATKLHARMGPGANAVGQSRLHVMEALEGSLRRLRTDHIDLYQLHNFDPFTPMETVLRSLDDAVRQGKVRYIGCSNYAAWQLTKALGISERERLEKFVSIQSFYSLACRDLEAEIIPAASDQGVGVLCWSPLAGGLLSGKFGRDGAAESTARRVTIDFPPVNEEKAFDIVEVLREIAAARGAEPAQVALAWLLGRPAVTSVILGVKRPEQLASNLAAMSLSLSPEEVARLDAVSGQAATYPGWIQSYSAKSRVPEGYPHEGPNWSAA
ncbi:aldo/keto reductase [Acetobacteraceae bacterium H6797]|nr:aldo/keto reductase [Acetobacteraceae bacterium H6797]